MQIAGARCGTPNAARSLCQNTGKVSSGLSTKNSVHEVPSCSLDIRHHVTIVLPSRPNVTAARKVGLRGQWRERVATTTERSRDGDAVFTTQLTRFMRISVNVLCATRTSCTKVSAVGRATGLAPKNKKDNKHENLLFI